jgi:hypothetical protein
MPEQLSPLSLSEDVVAAGILEDAERVEQDPKSEGVEPMAEEPKLKLAPKSEAPAQGSEGEDDEFPEQPGPDGWKKLREAYKAKKKGLAEAEQQLLAERAAKSDHFRPDAEPRKEAARQDDLSPDDVFVALAKIDNGDLDESYRADALRRIGEMSPSQVKDVIGKARANQFGGSSADVLKLAREALPEVLASHEERAKFSKERSEAEEIRRASIAEVSKAPGMSDTKSDVYKAYVNAALDLNKAFPGFWERSPQAPVIALRYMALIHQASLAQRVPELEKEVKELRLKLGIRESPSAPAGAAKATKEDADEELIQSLRVLRGEA